MARSFMLQLRLTKEELIRLRNLADEEGYSVSEYVREKLALDDEMYDF